jgi:hexosaminidase
MISLKHLSALITACFGLATFSNAQDKVNYQIVPLPQSIDMQQGNPFVLNSKTIILYPKNNVSLKSDASLLAQYLKESTGKMIKTLPASTKTFRNNSILLEYDKNISHKEGYTLDINAKRITIKGKDGNGVFYGIQTLRKSIPAVVTTASVSLPAVKISDYPRFGYRGMMLDCARHFFPTKFVKRYIDLLALHGMNYFHWHLTEDQGWRIEIKKYPKLTQIGSKRTETVIGHNSGKFDGQPYGGYYTQAEIKDIVAYAAARHITVVPEIDMPGHMLAALASYPYLGCTGGPYEVGKQWGVFDDVFCIGKESTFKFIEDVLDEVVPLFPSKLFHIGGDEAPRVRWKACPLCQKRIQEEGIKGDEKHSAEDRLQSYFTARIEKYLNKKGRSIIGWDEILDGDVAPGATVMSWRGVQGGIKAAKMHHNVIMTPAPFVYFDHYQSTDTKNEPLAIGGYLPIDTVYSFDPTKGLDDSEKGYILGAQANLWTEYIATEGYAEYMVLPRMAALSEVQWCAPEKKNFQDFSTRLVDLEKFYARDKYNYRK